MGRVNSRISVLCLAGALALACPAWADSDRKVYPGTGHVYQRIDSPRLVWAAARDHCENLEGHLATITSAGENEFLRAEIGGEVWLGGTDVRVEGQWEWITGESWSYSNWHPGEPNNLYPEHYLMMYGRGTWNDARGVDPRSFVCEWEDIAFDPFEPKVVVARFDPESASLDAFSLRGGLLLGDSSDGVDLPGEPVRVGFGTVALTIPAGSFQLDDEGRYLWEGELDGAEVVAVFEDRGIDGIAFAIDVKSIDLSGTANPTSVSLTIGNDWGETTERLEGLLQKREPLIVDGVESWSEPIPVER
jgi:hypothetical protein